MQAMSQVEFSSVAELNNEIVGYQISSGGRQGGHLARLAVDSRFQGMGVGRALMTTIAEHFDRLGAPQITVNTQYDNDPSLTLYRAFGFDLTGEHYPVWQLEV
jgi:ribosomal protein S18 acetylase RimI-like enzyme